MCTAHMYVEKKNLTFSSNSEKGKMGGVIRVNYQEKDQVIRPMIGIGPIRKIGLLEHSGIC